MLREQYGWPVLTGCTMMRWFAGSLGSFLALCVVAGCTRPCFLSKEVYDQAHSNILPQSMELDYTIGQHPLTGDTPPPPTILAPDRPPRYLSLTEAIAIGLENGTASTRSLQGANGPGSGLYDQSTVTNPPTNSSNTSGLTSQTDYIRVLSLNPAIAGADIEAALSRFDANWITSMNWTTTDNLLQGLNSFQNGSNASFQSSFVKELASGGFISASYVQNYQMLTQPPTTGGFTIPNPLYTSQVILGVEQPLLRNFGTRINQLLPGGALSPNVTGFGIPSQVVGQYSQRQVGPLSAGQLVSNDGILIARLRFDQNRADFERVMQGLILQVETAYWNLYQAYGQLYSFEESLRVAHRAWMIAHAQLQAGKINAADYSPVLGQYEDFRTQRTQAMGAVLDAERNLRFITGMPAEDGCRIVPITSPTLAHLQPDWSSSSHDALTLRPELVVARDNLRLAQYNLEIAENFMKPDLRLGAQYVPQGFGTTLQGRGTFADGTVPAGGPPNQPANALQSLVSGHFANWTVGVTMNVPLGFRLESAAVRAAKLGVAQSYFLVKDQENKALYSVEQQFQKLQEWYKRIETTRHARKAYAEAVDVRFKKILAGAALADISFLDFQTKLATAQVAEYTAIAEYNNSLSRFEWSKGTILRYNNVHIAEGPIPQCAQIRAVEHEKERSEAIVLRERPDPLTHPGRLAHAHDVPPPLLAPAAPLAEPAPSPLPPLGTKEKIEELPKPGMSKPSEAPVKPIAPPPPEQTQGPSLQGVSAPAGAQLDRPTLATPIIPSEPTFHSMPPAIELNFKATPTTPSGADWTPSEPPAVGRAPGRIPLMLPEADRPVTLPSLPVPPPIGGR
jgi:outer membrane protein TolC